MRNVRILIFVIALAFVYCWIKFYAFYGGVAQGPFGSSTKGDFIFYVELIANFVPIMFFAASIYCSVGINRQNAHRNNLRLFLALLLLIIAAIGGVFSNEEFGESNSFAYLQYHYDDWHFFSDNFLMENLILLFTSGDLFLYKLIRNWWA